MQGMVAGRQHRPQISAPRRLQTALAVCGFCLLSAVLCAQANPAPAALPPSAHTASGLLLSTEALTLQIDALRSDVLRVRIYPNAHPPEDASWAVLPGARTARVPVTSEASGFRTPAMRVSVSRDLRLTVSDLAGNVLQQDALPVAWSDDGFRVAKSKPADAHFFGLGDKPGPLDRAGEAFVMWNTDAFGWQESTDPIYKSIPFFLEMSGGRTIGVLFDNTFRTFFDFGRERNDRYTFGAPAGPLDYYLIYGPGPKQVVESYAWLTGPTPLPPLWALGYQQSRYSYYPQSRVEDIAAHLRRDRIPTDVIWLDIDYQYKNRPFTIDTARFPDFAGMVHQLAAENFRTVTITDLHIAHLPGQGYAPYDSGEAGNNFVKEDGHDYVGPVWPGPAVFPDFTRAQARLWWGGLFKQFVDDGVAGFWNDMDEPSVFVPSGTMPLDAVHRIEGATAEGFAPRTALHTEIHNVYGMENTRATMEGLLALSPNLRPFVMTRASYAGGQRYAVTWTGDNSSTWNHLRQTTPQLLNLGLSGFSLAGADVGGYAGSPPPDLLTKWQMLAAFQPIFRNHSSSDARPHEPWVDGPVQEAIRRRYIEERYRLLPYLYTAAEETSRDGMPIMRPLFLEFPNAATDGHPLDLDAPGEFMFGPDILVAASPSPEEIAPYEVVLAPGVWYDYWTGEKLDRTVPTGSGEVGAPAAAPLKPVMAEPKLDELPLYVRAGAIIPMQPLTQSTEELPRGPLILRVFPNLPGQPCQGDIYQDDGTSFDFRRGSYLRIHLTCSTAPDHSLTVSIAGREGKFHPWWDKYRIEIVDPRAVFTSYAEGKAAGIPEKTALGYSLVIDDTGEQQTLHIK
jgi:alpha-glucosidase